MKYRIDRASYLAGILTGLLLAVLICLLVWRHVSPKIQAESALQQISIAIKYLDDVPDGPYRQGMLDIIANTYTHCQMGLYDNEYLDKSIESAVERHADLVEEIKQREYLWKEN